MMCLRGFMVLVVVGSGVTAPAFGHGGGLDRQGCHRERATGTRHCHNGTSSPRQTPRDTRSEATDRPQPLLSSRLNEPSAMVRTAQKLLNKLGYRAGAEDGVIGEATRGAVAAFQRDQGQVPTGLIDQDLIDALIEALARQR